jgi:predicted nuclease with TOPRIM domain
MTNDVCLELKKEIMERVRNQLKQKEDAKIQELLAEIATLKTAIKSMENEHARSSKRVSHLEEENTKLAEANSELLRKLNLYEESEWEELSSFVESSCA